MPFDGELWFLTARAAGKTLEIRDRQAVHVTFASPNANRYAWASGKATVVDDPARLKTLWHAGYLPWLPGGPDDPSLTLIKVGVEEAEYWDDKAGRMVLLDHFIPPGSTFRDVAPGMGI